MGKDYSGDDSPGRWLRGEFSRGPHRQRKQRGKRGLASLVKVDSRKVKQRTRAIGEKRRWAVTGRAGGDGTEQEETMIPTEGKRIAGRAQGLVYWLILRNEHGRIEALTLDCKKTLPVFSHVEEAEMFLRLEDVGEGWQVNESRGGELISMLYGPCTSVKEVALDPLPGMMADRTVALVSLDRERFIRGVMARRGFCEPDRGSSPREVERRSEAYLIAVHYRAGGVA
jgi:hypothetical protein